uniref:Mut7-C RNAse domain-containing protein n=1 Tax=Candidatus Kentrum sp. DK TaxID=2126562 RepID=A0A450TF53_9GAMM|nr:MAG: Mut7-C RNAse domain-containing protein [Candidatus Kentron sp. DK]
MKFLVDAQLPRRLADWLRTQSFDAIHTLDMPDTNATSDKDIVDQADREGRVVVTKDDDFVRSFIVSGKPLRLLLISTGIFEMMIWPKRRFGGIDCGKYS